jgi:7-cyano-7-deazaguanine synthase
MSQEKERAVVICSGGMDSTALAWEVYGYGYEVHLVSFDYGQRHKKELAYATRTSNRLGVRHDVVDLSSLGSLLAGSGSSLVSGSSNVPEGHYAQDNMKQTVVPNRNMIMLSVAGGIAVATGALAVYTGVHAGDHFIYPDCRPIFIDMVSRALFAGNEGFGNLQAPAIRAPFLYNTKADIALRMLEFSIPFEETWSCYNGGENHCGKCGTCVERLEAIAEAQERFFKTYGRYGRADRTVYDDESYWKGAVGAHKA